MTPAFDDYEWKNLTPDFSQTSEVNKLNFSLAMQLSARWLRTRREILEKAFVGDILHSVDDKFVEAFRKCQFEGRFQRIEQDNVTFFLDGAHTKESLEICTDWFEKQIEGSKGAINVLVFNVTGDRDSAVFLSLLRSKNFHHVLFSTNISISGRDNEKFGERKLKTDLNKKDN